LVCSAVSSCVAARVERPELTSIAVSASVASMTIEPPLASSTRRSKMFSTCGSI